MVIIYVTLIGTYIMNSKGTIGTTTISIHSWAICIYIYCICRTITTNVCHNHYILPCISMIPMRTIYSSSIFPNI